jgi:2-methylisocitrate lyase-like PEP mutase family enzyme
VKPSTSVLLRELLAHQVIAPGCYDALSAALIEQSGFAAAYLSGASIAYTKLGRPDIGLVCASEVADTIAHICDRVPSLPLIVDADTGFGNALNVQRTVQMFERAGAAALQLEDQAAPKRCGHLSGKRLISSAEMVGKIRAASDARSIDSTIIIARTDAIAVEGFAAALQRAEAYLQAGADVLFVEAPQSVEQLRTISNRFAQRIPLLANMVEGGSTPMLGGAALRELGFRLVIFPGALVRVFAWTAQRFLADLRDQGNSASWSDRMFDLNGLNGVLGTQTLLQAGRAYDPDIHDSSAKAQ